MAIEERIEYAEEKRNEAIDNDDDRSIVYWQGYIDALKAVKRDNA